MTPIPVLSGTTTDGRLDLAAGGPWTAAHADALERLVDEAAPQVAAARRLDTIGAWLLERLVRSSDRDGRHA
jgi:phospholipid/cholesterol/gamma-HCH transport system permease protein